MVILVSGSDEQRSSFEQLHLTEILEILLQSLPLKEAARVASQITGEAKNKLYKQALEIQQKK